MKQENRSCVHFYERECDLLQGSTKALEGACLCLSFTLCVVSFSLCPCPQCVILSLPRYLKLSLPCSTTNSVMPFLEHRMPSKDSVCLIHNQTIPTTVPLPSFYKEFSAMNSHIDSKGQIQIYDPEFASQDFGNDLRGTLGCSNSLQTGFSLQSDLECLNSGRCIWQLALSSIYSVEVDLP